MLSLVAFQAGLELDSETLTASQSLAEHLAASEWIGPLAPLAVSPFFGLALLSGAATYGPDWLQERSALFADTSALSSPVLFWIMLTLAVLTSLPRFTKVSKPLALAAEHLEAYSVLIIYAVVRLAAFWHDAGGEVELGAEHVAAAGLAALPFEALMLLFAALNLLVINAVKLFFEFAVWLVPFPSVDALLETANKLFCALLMGLYMLSPTAAAILNLILLGVCLVLFGWCYRRLNLYREVIVGPLLAWLFPRWFGQRGLTYRAFSGSPFGSLPRFSMLSVTRQENGDVEIVGGWLWRRHRQVMRDCTVERCSGLVIQTVILRDGTGQELRMAHRRWVPQDDCFDAFENRVASVQV